jgi:hypothetical protein
LFIFMSLLLLLAKGGGIVRSWLFAALSCFR